MLTQCNWCSHKQTASQKNCAQGGRDGLAHLRARGTTDCGQQHLRKGGRISTNNLIWISSMHRSGAAKVSCFKPLHCFRLMLQVSERGTEKFTGHFPFPCFALYFSFPSCLSSFPPLLAPSCPSLLGTGDGTQDTCMDPQALSPILLLSLLRQSCSCQAIKLPKLSSNV